MANMLTINDVYVFDI